MGIKGMKWETRKKTEDEYLIYLKNRINELTLAASRARASGNELLNSELWGMIEELEKAEETYRKIKNKDK